MDNHISFEEMADALFYRKYDADAIRLIGRINAHILQCKDCRDMYMAMLSYSDAVEARARQEEAPSLSKRAAAVLNRIRTIVDLRIGQAHELVAERVTDLAPFFTPSFSVVTKSTGDPTKAPATPILLNRDGIRIEYRGQDTLAVFLPMRICKAGEWVILQSRQNPGSIAIQDSRPYSDDTVFVRFKGVRPDDYTIKCGPRPEQQAP